MCLGEEIYCMVCKNVMYSYKDDNDKGENLFTCCEHFEDCFAEDLKYIDIIHHYNDTCKACEKKIKHGRKKNYVR